MLLPDRGELLWLGRGWRFSRGDHGSSAAKPERDGILSQPAGPGGAVL